MPVGGIAVDTGGLGEIVRPLVPTGAGATGVDDGAAVMGGGCWYGETTSFGETDSGCADMGGAGACAAEQPRLRSCAADVSRGNDGVRLPAVSANMPVRRCSYGCRRPPAIGTNTMLNGSSAVSL